MHLTGGRMSILSVAVRFLRCSFTPTTCGISSLSVEEPQQYDTKCIFWCLVVHGWCPCGAISQTTPRESPRDTSVSRYLLWENTLDHSTIKRLRVFLPRIWSHLWPIIARVSWQLYSTSLRLSWQKACQPIIKRYSSSRQLVAVRRECPSQSRQKH